MTKDALKARGVLADNADNPVCSSMLQKEVVIIFSFRALSLTTLQRADFNLQLDGIQRRLYR